MKNARAIWLLDVDGVLNAFDESRPVVGDWGDWATFTTRGLPVRYSPKMVGRILGLHEAGKVEIRWLTTWGRWANTDLKQLGLPEFTVAAESPYREPDASWWKLSAAQDLFAQGHMIIWTDDDIVFDTDAVQWLDEVANSERAGDLHAFAPQGAISQQEMDDIERWLDGR